MRLSCCLPVGLGLVGAALDHSRDGLNKSVDCSSTHRKLSRADGLFRVSLGLRKLQHHPTMQHIHGVFPRAGLHRGHARLEKPCRAAALTSLSCVPCPTCARPRGGTRLGIASRARFGSWCYRIFTRYIKVTVLNGSSLRPVPLGSGKDKDSRWVDIYEAELDEERSARRPSCPAGVGSDNL